MILKAASLFLAAAMILLGAAQAQVPQGQPATSQPPARPAKRILTLEDTAARRFTGDLDGMIARRAIRVLVPFSKTFYTIDRGTQRGLAVEIGRVLEESVNQRPDLRKLRVPVVFVVVHRDEVLPALLDGRGDVAIANLTITPERLEKVDFTAPFRRDVKEVVVAVKMKMFGCQLPNLVVLSKKGRSDPSKKSSFSLYQSKKPKSLIIS